MISRTRGKLLIALEKERELEETISLALPSVSPQPSPDSVYSSKSSFIRKKLDDAFNKECDLFLEASSQKVEKQINKLKIKQLLELYENEMHQKIMENHANGKLTTSQYRV